MQEKSSDRVSNQLRCVLTSVVVAAAPACNLWSPGTTTVLSTCANVDAEAQVPDHAQAVAAVAEAWDQWRGPQRDGVGSATALPSALPARLQRVWCAEVGEGHSGPLVEGDRVYVHSRQGDQEVVRALLLRDGSTVWQQAYDAPYKVTQAAIDVGPGPKSTPLLAGGRLFTFGITEKLSAWDADTGSLLWRREFSEQFATTSPLYGSATSPIAVDNMLILNVGGQQDGALTAFDLATGTTTWAVEGLPPGYASPVWFADGEIRQLVTQSKDRIVGVDPSVGEVLWEMPFETSMDQNIITPLVYGDRLILSGLDKGVFAIELRGGAPVEVWRNDDFPLRITSPVLVANRLFGMSHKRSGQFFCLDADSGEEIWSSTGREGLSTAIVALGNRVAFLSDEARLIIVEAGADRYEPLAEYEVADSATWAHPVFVPGGVLVKDVNTLQYWSF